MLACLPHCIGGIRAAIHGESSQNSRRPAPGRGIPARQSLGQDSGNAGGGRIDAPAIQAVWKQFSEAIDNADDWLTTDEPVPARPLQESSQWPDGATIVLEEKLKEGSVQTVCRYCDYQDLCGLQENA